MHFRLLSFSKVIKTAIRIVPSTISLVLPEDQQTLISFLTEYCFGATDLAEVQSIVQVRMSS